MIDGTDYFLAQHLSKQDKSEQMQDAFDRSASDALEFLESCNDWQKSDSFLYESPDFYIDRAVNDDVDATVIAAMNSLFSSDAADEFRRVLADYIARQELGDD